MTTASSIPSASIVPDLPLPVRNGTPLCWVVDEDASLRHFLSLILHGAGIDTIEFAEGGALRHAIGKKSPDLVFHNIALESADAVESVLALAKHGFAGSIQLMSQRGAAVLEHVKAMGVQHHLRMLPPLKKPFETDAVVKIISDLKLGFANAGATVTLTEALAKDWVEFWYQPKIDLRRKQLSGVEAFARVRHPEHGVIMPGAFMPGATDADMLKLAELSIERALKAQTDFGNLGIHLRMAVNIPLPVLVQLPVEQLVRAQRKPGEKWAGLIIDVTEQQILAELATAIDLTKKFEASNVRLAVDDFGKGYSEMVKVKQLPFAELKLDRSFVTDCGTDKVKAPLCKTAVDLAHHFGSTVVGVGIEKASEAVALVSMGCDFGQGFLLGQPMSQERFLSLLRQRGVGAKTPAAAS